MKVVVCDSEPAVRKHLVALVEELGHEAITQIERLDEIIPAIRSYQPEIVLLSIHMQGIVELCQKMANEFTRLPALLFSGLDDAHSILSALQAGASDYLLIPVGKNELKVAFNKACRINTAQETTLKIQSSQCSRQRQCIAARTHRGVELIALSDVYYFTADQKYVKVRHKNGVVLIDETLKDLEQEFEGMMFRIHRNALINLEYLDLLETVDSGQYQVRFRGLNEVLAVSRRHLPALREKMNNI